MDFSRIPVLNYHKIEIKSDIGITARHPDDFLTDMQYLAEHGFTSVTFQSVSKSETLPDKPVMITFDDGYASVYEHAFPILSHFRFRAVIFMPALYIGKTNDWDIQLGSKKFLHLSGEQIAALSAAEHEIAAHGLNHVPFTSLNSESLNKELKQSRILLEKITGIPVTALCYPFGRFNARVIQAVKQAGYQYAMASLYLGAAPPEEQNMALRRFNVYRFDTQRIIHKKLKAAYQSPIAIRDWLLQLGGRATPLYQRLMGLSKQVPLAQSVLPEELL